MRALNNTRRNAVLLVLLLFAQLLLMSGSVKQGEGATLLEAWTVGATSPVMSVANLVGGAFSDAATWSREILSADERRDELEEEVKHLRAELQLRREATLENTRLRRLLGMREELEPAAIGASVVTSSLTPQARLIVVDRGERDGVRRDLPVVAWGGVVGRVVAAFDRHAKVQLITDPNSGVAGIVQRSRSQGLVLGQGAQPLELVYVRRFDDVMEGDRVVTSGLDGIFPRGYSIGTVRSIHETPTGTQLLRLEPELDYGSLEEVLILLESAGGGVARAATN